MASSFSSTEIEDSAASASWSTTRLRPKGAKSGGNRSNYKKHTNTDQAETMGDSCLVSLTFSNFSTNAATNAMSGSKGLPLAPLAPRLHYQVHRQLEHWGQSLRVWLRSTEQDLLLPDQELSWAVNRLWILFYPRVRYNQPITNH